MLNHGWFGGYLAWPEQQASTALGRSNSRGGANGFPKSIFASYREARRLGGVLNYLSERDSEAFFVLAPTVGALGEVR